MAELIQRKLILESGEEYIGTAFGAVTDRVCELVFNTSMAGYQEVISDPAYTYQAVVMTYPLIGNYGIADDDFESRVPTLGALIVREYNDRPSNFRYTKTLGETLEEYGIPGLVGIDTRKLTRRLRSEGSCRALITGADTTLEDGLRIIAQTPVPHDAVSVVSCRKRWFSRTTNHCFNVLAIDCGIKLSLIRALNERGCNVTVVPFNTPAEEILSANPDGVVVCGGPGDPMDIIDTVETVRALRGRVPMFGIGLGFEVIALAMGARTEKMKVGHHGGNQPARNLATGKLEIIAQDHNFTVDPASLEGTGLTVTHVNVLDESIEGMACAEEKLFCLQYQPDSAEGPQGNAYLYAQFIRSMKEAQENA